jgi:diguanylate cyclase (GGDEF)-like protein
MLVRPDSVIDWPSRLRLRVARAPERCRGIHRVWGLNLVIVASAAALYGAHVSGLPALARPHVSWPVMALAYFLAKRSAVEVRIGRGSHGFSMQDAALVFGLIFCSADQLVLGCLLGSGLVAVSRRQPPVKLVFNTAHTTLRCCVAIMLIHAVGAANGRVGPDMWIAALVAVAVSAVPTQLLVSCAIAVAAGGGRRHTIADFVGSIGPEAAVTVCNGALGLCAAVIAAANALALVLFLIPAGMLFIAYRAYGAERERHTSLDFLYEVNRTLAFSADMDSALEGLLARAVDAFHTEVAEIVLLGSEDSPSLTTFVGLGGQRQTMKPIDPALARELRELLDLTAGTSVLEPPFPERLQSYLDARGATRAMLAPLPGEPRAIGAIILANRYGTARRFTRQDRRLLEALATNASVALQNDRLEQFASELTALQEQLHQQAFHDPLTGLANRALFTEKLREALTDRHPNAGLLFLDLDNFKTINDTLGHLAGDELLVEVASRLRGTARPEDLIARLGGDEFAILTANSDDPDKVAVAIAQRVIGAFAHPVALRGQTVSVQVSIGIATTRAGNTAENDLIHQADVAMYQAKLAGKGRYRVFDPTLEDPAADKALGRPILT